MVIKCDIVFSNSIIEGLKTFIMLLLSCSSYVDFITRGQDEITFYTKMVIKVDESYCLLLYQKKENKWDDENIDKFQKGSFNDSLRQNFPRAVSNNRRRTVVNSRRSNIWGHSRVSSK